MITGACIRCTPVPAHFSRAHVAAALLAAGACYGHGAHGGKGGHGPLWPHVAPPVRVRLSRNYIPPLLLAYQYNAGTTGSFKKKIEITFPDPHHKEIPRALC
jgi:hypothetical protein